MVKRQTITAVRKHG